MPVHIHLGQEAASDSEVVSEVVEGDGDRSLRESRGKRGEHLAHELRAFIDETVVPMQKTALDETPLRRSSEVARARPLSVRQQGEIGMVYTAESPISFRMDPNAMWPDQ